MISIKIPTDEEKAKYDELYEIEMQVKTLMCMLDRVSKAITEYRKAYATEIVKVKESGGK